MRRRGGCTSAYPGLWWLPPPGEPPATAAAAAAAAVAAVVEAASSPAEAMAIVCFRPARRVREGRTYQIPSRST